MLNLNNKYFSIVIYNKNKYIVGYSGKHTHINIYNYMINYNKLLRHTNINILMIFVLILKFWNKQQWYIIFYFKTTI